MWVVYFVFLFRCCLSLSLPFPSCASRGLDMSDVTSFGAPVRNNTNNLSFHYFIFYYVIVFFSSFSLRWAGGGGVEWEGRRLGLGVERDWGPVLASPYSTYTIWLSLFTYQREFFLFLGYWVLGHAAYAMCTYFLTASSIPSNIEGGAEQVKKKPTLVPCLIKHPGFFLPDLTLHSKPRRILLCTSTHTYLGIVSRSSRCFASFGWIR